MSNFRVQLVAIKRDKKMLTHESIGPFVLEVCELVKDVECPAP